MKNLLVFITLLFCFGAIVFTGCKKESNSEEFSDHELQIINKASEILPDNMLDVFKNDIKSNKNQVNYDKYIDTLNFVVSRLYEKINEIQIKKSNKLKSANFSVSDLKKKLKTFQEQLNKMNNLIECELKDIGLGYGKGISISASAGLPVVDVLSGLGGGGFELVYDFPTMQSSIIPYTFCGVNGNIGLGLSAGIAQLDLSGYYDWILGLQTNGSIQELEAPSQSISFTISTDLTKLLEIPLGIGANIGTYIDSQDPCSPGTIIQCPTLSGLNKPIKGITIGFDASLAGSFYVAALSGTIVNTCNFYRPELTRNYLDNIFHNRIIASWNMAYDILTSNPQIGINNPFVAIDITAACAALTYGIFNPNDCNSVVPPQGLLAYYPFNGNANDESGNGNNGTLIGDSKFLEGKIGQSLYLDGEGDYVNVGTGLNFTKDYSVSVWIKSECNSRRYPGIFAKYATNLYGPYDFDLHYGKIDLWISNGSGGYTDIYSDIAVQENKWEFITWVVKDNYLKMYLNTENIKEGILPQITQRNDIVTIGRQYFMFEPYSDLEFKGYIDELRVYNKALTETEILQLYNGK